MTPELQSKISEWRHRAIAGTLSGEEMKAAILALRESRWSASEASAAKKRTSTKGPTKSADDMLSELEGL